MELKQSGVKLSFWKSSTVRWQAAFYFKDTLTLLVKINAPPLPPPLCVSAWRSEINTQKYKSALQPVHCLQTWVNLWICPYYVNNSYIYYILLFIITNNSYYWSIIISMVSPSLVLWQISVNIGRNWRW